MLNKGIIKNLKISQLNEIALKYFNGLEKNLIREIDQIASVKNEFKQHPEELLPHVFDRYNFLKGEMKKYELWENKYEEAFLNARDKGIAYTEEMRKSIPKIQDC